MSVWNDCHRDARYPKGFLMKYFCFPLTDEQSSHLSNISVKVAVYPYVKRMKHSGLANKSAAFVNSEGALIMLSHVQRMSKTDFISVSGKAPHTTFGNSAT